MLYYLMKKKCLSLLVLGSGIFIDSRFYLLERLPFINDQMALLLTIGALLISMVLLGMLLFSSLSFCEKKYPERTEATRDFIQIIAYFSAG